MKKSGKSNGSRRFRRGLVGRWVSVGFVALLMSLAIVGASIGSAPPAGRAKALDNLLFEPSRGANSLNFAGIGPVAPFSTITVTTTNQGIVGGDGLCSLQEAIFAANWNTDKAIDPSNLNGPPITNTGCTAGTGTGATPDVIELPANGVFLLSALSQHQFNIAGMSANPDIRSAIIIHGNGSRLERTGVLNIRAFVVNRSIVPEVTQDPDEPDENPIGDLTIQNLHLKGFIAKGGDGAVGGGGGLGAGGAIWVRNGTLTIDNSTFENNTATGGNGAASTGTAGGGGGGGVGGNGGGSGSNGGGGGGGARGNGGLAGNSGGGGGGTANDGVSGGAGVGGNGGFNCGGKGGDFSPQAVPGGNGFCTGGGAGGGAQGTGAGVDGGTGGIGNYGGGAGGGGASSAANGGAGGNGGFGGGGGRAGVGPAAGGNGGFGGGGAGGNGTGSAGSSGTFGGDGSAGGGGGGGGLGGAIFNDSGTVTIRNSTFKGNTATGGTGANVGQGAGGAIFSRNGTLTVLNVTLSNNTATLVGGGIQAVGDGGTANLTIRNTILANNGSGECGTFTSNGGVVSKAGSGNLIMSNGNCLGVASTTDPNLGALQLNSPGNTPTMAITNASSAFNTADGPTSLATDQRGVPRPQLGGSDIGAFELDCQITCPANVVQANDPNQCGAVVTYPAPTTSSGSCGTVTCSPASGSFFPVGTTTVTCTAAAGPSCNFTVKVNDTQLPTITCPGSIAKFTDSGQLGATITTGAPVALDNCPGLTIAGVRSDGKPLNALYPIGVTIITWTATDASGNKASCGQTITVMVPSGQQRKRIP